MPAPDPFKIFMNAERFRIADRLLRSDQHRDLLVTVASPSMVLSAFASELYFKCIIAMETKGKPTPQSHDLEALFKMLSLASRKRLEQLWNIAEANPQVARMRAALLATTGDTIPTDLAWSLKNGRSAFIRLRYVHEDDGMGTSFMLTDLPEMLRQVVVEMQPVWQFITHGPPKLVPGFGPLNGSE